MSAATVERVSPRHLVNGQTIQVTVTTINGRGFFHEAKSSTAKRDIRLAEVVSVERHDSGYWAINTTLGVIPNLSPNGRVRVVA